MAVREIKTRLVLDGEQEFSKTLKAAERNLRSMDSELKVAQSEFELTGDKQALLTSKSDILRQKIKQEEEILRGLTAELENAKATYGETGQVVDRYQKKIFDTTAAMNKLQKELQETEEGLRAVGTESDDAGKGLDGLSDKMDSISFSTGVSALRDGWDMATGAFSAAIDLADGTRELRRTMAYLEQNAKSAGVDFSDVQTQLNNVVGLTGEVDGAVEGISNLLATGFDSTNLTDAVDLLSGAAIKFKDTLSFEGLSDSLQETIGSDTATGQFAELIERMGGDLEAFNKALQAAPTDAEQMKIALGTLKDMGLDDVTAEFKANNQAMIDAEVAAQKWQTAMAGLGSVMEQIITPIRSNLADIITDATSFMQMTLDGGLYGNTKAYMEWANERAEKKIKWQEENGIEVVEIPVTLETTNLRGELAALDEEINAAYSAGDSVKAWTLEGQREALLAQITALETEAALGAEQAGAAAVSAADKALRDGAGTLEENAGIIGGNAGTEIGNGIAEAAPYAQAQAAALADGVLSELERVNQFRIQTSLFGLSAGIYATPVSGGSYGTGSAGAGGNVKTREISVNLNVNGKTLARTLVNDIDAALA